MRQEKSTILIRPTGAAAKRCSAFISIWTSYRKAAMKNLCLSRWHGYATMIGTRWLRAECWRWHMMDSGRAPARPMTWLTAASLADHDLNPMLALIVNQRNRWAIHRYSIHGHFYALGARSPRKRNGVPGLFVSII